MPPSIRGFHCASAGAFVQCCRVCNTRAALPFPPSTPAVGIGVWLACAARAMAGSPLQRGRCFCRAGHKWVLVPDAGKRERVGVRGGLYSTWHRGPAWSPPAGIKKHTAHNPLRKGLMGRGGTAVSFKQKAGWGNTHRRDIHICTLCTE